MKYCEIVSLTVRDFTDVTRVDASRAPRSSSSLVCLRVLSTAQEQLELDVIHGVCASFIYSSAPDRVQQITSHTIEMKNDKLVVTNGTRQGITQLSCLVGCRTKDNKIMVDFYVFLTQHGLQDGKMSDRLRATLWIASRTSFSHVCAFLANILSTCGVQKWPVKFEYKVNKH